MANGLSPGLDEQSEYFDATENPLFRDKQRQDIDDEDSGLDNFNQLLRDAVCYDLLTLPAMCTVFFEKKTLKVMFFFF